MYYYYYYYYFASDKNVFDLYEPPNPKKCQLRISITKRILEENVNRNCLDLRRTNFRVRIFSSILRWIFELGFRFGFSSMDVDLFFRDGY